MDAVEGAGEDEVVVGGDLGGGGRVGVWGEVAVVDEAAGFIDDQEGVDGPGWWVERDSVSGCSC